MILMRLHRFLMLLPLALAACTNPDPAAATQVASPPRGIDLGSSGPVTMTPPPPAASARPAPAGEPKIQMQTAHDGRNDVHATGTVNSVDTAGHKVNVTHEPIPDIGWPSMTMDFAVAPAVDLRAIKPGSRVNFSMEKGQGGMYQIRAITPAGR